MKIGIIGGGVVGHATAKAFVEHVEEVRVYDVLKERRTHCRDEVCDCDLVFLCLPTPQKEGSLECDTSVIEMFFEERQAFGGTDCNYVLRSTVPIGFTRRMRDKYHLPNLVHSPEFLTARCAVTDAMLPTRNIIGIPGWRNLRPDDDDPFYEDGTIGHVLYNLYQQRFPGIPTYVMTSDESEATKLFLNSFFAVKVAYFNEIHTLATRLGLDWDRVREGILSDGRISHNHTQVPGPDGKFGFGPDLPDTNTPAPGACLPKDLASLIDCMQKAGVHSYLCKAVNERNPKDRARRDT